MNKQEQFDSACKTGDLKVVKQLINDPKVDPADINNYAIQVASENGHSGVVKRLLKDKRVDPADDNNLAIRWASKKGHLEIVKLLVDHILNKIKEENNDE